MISHRDSIRVIVGKGLPTKRYIIVTEEANINRLPVAGVPNQEPVIWPRYIVFKWILSAP